MSALAMIVTAAMAVPGDGSEKVSAEMEQGLDLSGEWEGTFWDSEAKNKKMWTAILSDEWLVVEQGIDTRRMLWQMTDEGGGKVRVKLSGTVYLGIYRHESDRITIALRDSKRGRPFAFRFGDDQSLLILRRAKPGPRRHLGIDKVIETR